MIRERFHAQISSNNLAQETGLGEMTHHRMLGRRGNTTTRKLFAATKAIYDGLAFNPRVTVAVNSRLTYAKPEGRQSDGSRRERPPAAGQNHVAGAGTR